MYLKSTKYVSSISLYQFSICALLNACSVICFNCMVQLNKDERVWVCFEIAKVQNAHTVQRLWPNRSPVKRVPTIHAILKNYRKYRQHGTSLNKNKQWEIFSVFKYIVSKGDIKDKKLWFQSTTSFCLLQLIAQSLSLRF